MRRPPRRHRRVEGSGRRGADPGRRGRASRPGPGAGRGSRPFAAARRRASGSPVGAAPVIAWHGRPAGRRRHSSGGPDPTQAAQHGRWRRPPPESGADQRRQSDGARIGPTSVGGPVSRPGSGRSRDIPAVHSAFPAAAGRSPPSSRGSRRTGREALNSSGGRSHVSSACVPRPGCPQGVPPAPPNNARGVVSAGARLPTNWPWPLTDARRGRPSGDGARTGGVLPPSGSLAGPSASLRSFSTLNRSGSPASGPAPWS